MTHCKHCQALVLREHGHWIAPPADRRIVDGQDYSRARTCDASPMMARLHAPS